VHTFNNLAGPMTAWGTQVSGLRYLANVLADAALHAQLHGDDAEAIQRIQDTLHLADAMSTRTFLIGRLVGIGAEALALDRLRVIAPGLHIQNGAADSASRTAELIHPVPRKVIVELIGQLLDEVRQRQQQRYDLWQERALGYDTAQRLIAAQVILRPMIQLELGRELDRWQYTLRALDQSDWPSGQAIFARQPPVSPQLGSGGFALPRFSRLMGLIGGASLGKYVEFEWRLTADRRAAAVSLAVQLYRADSGKWPANLEVLVPAYLPAVPRDPFLPGGPPLGYELRHAALPDGSDRPLLYFGSTYITSGPPAEPVYAWAGSGYPQWRDLARWSPPPTTQSATTWPADDE